MSVAGRSGGGLIQARLARLVLLLLLVAGVPTVHAARILAVLSGNSEPYQSLTQALRERLDGQGHELVVTDVSALDPRRIGDVKLVVCVGVRAAEKVADLPLRAPVLAVLVPRQWFVDSGRDRLSAGGKRHVSAIVIDQPVERRAALLRLAFPEARRVGVLVGPAQAGTLPELEQALRAVGLQLVGEVAGSGAELIGGLERVLGESDLLLAQPDPEILNSNTAQIVLLTSYRYGDPVVGYSRSLTTAGALLSLHSSPAQLGRQAGEWVSELMSGVAKSPALLYPRYFDVSVNAQVARSLGFAVPDEQGLERRLRERER